MSDVYIVSACRTAIGSFQGQFSGIGPVQLAIPVVQEAITRAGISPSDIDEVNVGNVLSAGKAQNVGRQISLGAKIPQEVPASTINFLCGSGLKIVYNGYNSIKAGSTNIVLCGATESMTEAEYTVNMRSGSKLGNVALKDSLLHDGLTDPFNKVHMGVTAEEVATRFNISREDQDKFALESQLKASNAIKSGFFDAEIVGVKHPKSGEVMVKDEFPRPNATLEGLAKLKPVFKPSGGTVTAGNASGINDGAAAVVLASEKAVIDKGLKPLAKIIGLNEVGGEPLVMGIVPIKAIRGLLAKINWSLNDIDLFELNEAFASQSLAIIRDLGVDISKVNVTGGAIALGHPIGASGSRVLVTLIHNLKRLNKKRGLAALCIGGGMGIAVAIELVN